MSDKDLQGLTECVSYIGQPPSRQNHITQKVRIADQRTLFLSVPDDALPGAIFHERS